MDVPPPQFSSLSSPFHLHLHSSVNSFPVIAIALIGILATAFLLVAYYVFVIKCCLNWHRIDVLNRFTSRRRNPDGSTANLTSPDGLDAPKGLDEAIIRSIPVIKFRKMAEQERYKNGGLKSEEPAATYECAVCLSEFEDGEKLRVIPNCCHAFHIDCIDIWLQSSANCPLCRSSISPSSILWNTGRIFPENGNRNPDNFTGNDDDYVVIEIEGNNLEEPRLVKNAEESEEGEERKKKGKKLEDVGSVGDEWIEMREKDEEFRIVQPIRRSISMDLSVDREFNMEIEECCRGGKVGEVSSGTSESCSSSSSSSSSSKVRRSIFSFGYGRSSRGSVQPLP